MDRGNVVCVCAENYYQISGQSESLVCAVCPAGSTTQGVINSQDISACSKYSIDYHT